MPMAKTNQSESDGPQQHAIDSLEQNRIGEAGSRLAATLWDPEDFSDWEIICSGEEFR